MFCVDLIIVVTVADEVGTIIAKCQLDDIADGRGFGEEGFNV